MKYLIANWKQNKDISDINNWLEYVSLSTTNKKVSFKNIKVILCPSFLHIQYLKSKLDFSILNLFKIGAQDVSNFENGSHTGNVGASQLKEFVQYSIIGHSERRQGGEDFQMVGQKIKLAQKNNIIPIICFSNVEEHKDACSYLDLKKEHLFAYEPIESIGTGNPASLENIAKIMENTGIDNLVYGGSVDEKTISEYLSDDRIIGFLVGKASLNPTVFVDLVNKLN